MSFWNPDFSHIYIEEAAMDYSLTRRILKRFSGADSIPVKDYREIFNRPRQRFQQQKQSLKLILAVKKEGFLYKGSDNAQDYGTPNFYYSSPVLNCLYNCDYCFLQGMYSSANLVVFVNQEELIQAALEATGSPPDPGKPVFIAISYNTDLMAMEPWLGVCRQWIEATRDIANLQIEMRTKSGNFRSLRGLAPSHSAILAWTLSPGPIFRRYEKGTAPPAVRIRAVQEALTAGWPVRLSIDPVLKVHNWRSLYADFIEELFQRIDAGRILDISTGVFRMSGRYYKKIRSRQPASDLYYYPFESRDGLVKYRDEDQEAMMAFLVEQLSRHLPEDKIEVWA